MRLFCSLLSLAFVAGCTSSEVAAPAPGDTKDSQSPPTRPPPPPPHDLPPNTASAVEAPAATHQDASVLTGDSSGSLFSRATTEPRGARSGSLSDAKGKRDSRRPGFPAPQEKVHSRAKIGEVENLGESTLTPNKVARKLRTRFLAAIKGCHVQAMVKNPKAMGRVNFAFSVSASGRVTKSSVQGFDPSMDQCLKKLSLGWRFEAPKDDSGKAVSVGFEVPMLFKPSS